MLYWVFILHCWNTRSFSFDYWFSSYLSKFVYFIVIKINYLILQKRIGLILKVRKFFLINLFIFILIKDTTWAIYTMGLVMLVLLRIFISRRLTRLLLKDMYVKQFSHFSFDRYTLFQLSDQLRNESGFRGLTIEDIIIQHNPVSGKRKPRYYSISNHRS